MFEFGVASYGTAALVYGAITAILLASHPRRRSAIWVVSATAVSALWGAGMVVLLASDDPSLAAVVGLDALHALAWTACVLSWLGPSGTDGQKLSGRILLFSVSALLGAWSVVASLFSTITETSAVAGAEPALPIGTQGIYLALLGLGLLGLLAVEQVFRNAREDQREKLRLLSFGIGGIFVLNVFVYSQASLLGGPISIFWEARGAANAALGPLILIAIKRQSEWERQLFVSRQVTFYTASLVAVGAYLLAMGAVGYLIRAVGGHWGLLLESLFLAAALAILIFVLFSATIRARARVFLVKHFYRNKYDYRHEWLRLTNALSRTGDSRVLAESALEGLAGILGSREASLWLAGSDARYEPAASLEPGLPAGQRYEPTHPIVAFLAAKGWVIDSDEYSREPERYRTAFGDPAEGTVPKNSIIVPLDCQGYLQGFAILSKPPEVEALNFEDHDILKTAGRQVAVVLAQALAQEQLTATRQFEAVNKLATFLMHDLKNLITQQELVLANAQRFRLRPEFIDDALTTVQSSVERMKKVLEQLQAAAYTAPNRSRVDVSKVLLEVRSHCADRKPVPEVEVAGSAAWVDIDRDKLASVLTHIIRNAQDATPPTGSIVVHSERAGGDLLITVADTGNGMDRVFIRDRLFRPFDSTKGAKGMGIGAYQVRDTVRAAGGDVEVQSEPGVGTTFQVRLPIASNAAGVMLKQPAA